MGTFSVIVHKGFAVSFLFKYPSTEPRRLIYGLDYWSQSDMTVLYLCQVLIMHLIHILLIELSVNKSLVHF